MEKENGQKMRKWKKIILGFAVVLIILLISAFAYLSQYSPAIESEIELTLNNSEGFTYEENRDYISLNPENPSGVNIIFYPGGKVDEMAYIPMLAKLAEEGINVYIIRMPFKLAVFNINGADNVLPAIENSGQNDKIYLAGHSLGGAMISVYASQNPGVFDGIILLSAYSTADISDTGLKVISISGTEDLVLNRENFEKYMDNLPTDTSFLEIEGGNHAYFGNYGEQKGDGVASISRQEQQDITVSAILNFTGGVGSSGRK